MSASVRAIYRIEARADGPARARRIITGELARVLPRRRLEDVKLMISELVTNAVKYATKNKNEQITLDLRLGPEICCSVIDTGDVFPATREIAEPSAWGLKVVDRLAERWGVTRTRGRTSVWFATSCA
jgi:anti-sigma regulatory factor (Ser/Thr protein kinase)